MRIRRHSNPRSLNSTPEQEAEYIRLQELTESRLMRARVLERGVGQLLHNASEYIDDIGLRELFLALGESVSLRELVQKERAMRKEIERQTDLQAETVPKKRPRKTV